MWFLSTVTVVVLLFGYHTSTQGAQGPTTVVVGPSIGTTGGAASTVAGASRGANRSSTGGTRHAKQTSHGASRKSAGGTSHSASTATGATVQTEWGPVQVQLTVRAGRIIRVSLLQYHSGNPQDDQINAYAIPTLVQETLRAQSANIDMVSGATVTSGGYLRSLQSALDQAQL